MAYNSFYGGFIESGRGPIWDAIRALNQFGIIDIILPFVLIYSLVYAVLRKSHVFTQLGESENTQLGESENKSYVVGELENKIYVVIALCLAILFVAPHVLYFNHIQEGNIRFNSGPLQGIADPVQVILLSLPTILIWLVVVLMFMILTGMVGQGNFLGNFAGQHVNAVAAIAGIIVVYIFGVSAKFWPNLRTLINYIFGTGAYGQPLLDTPTAMITMVILTLGFFVWWVQSGTTGGGAGGTGGGAGGGAGP